MSSTPDPRTNEVRNMKLLGQADLDGAADGMHVNVKDGHAYFGHQGNGGTSIFDVRDPREPRLVNQIPAPPNTHSHKVQVLGDTLLVNRERMQEKLGGTFQRPWVAGLSIFDVSVPARPLELAFWPCAARGVHRTAFWSEPYAYVTAGASDFDYQILMVLDLSDRADPKEVARWWIPGMRRDEAGQRTWGPDRVAKFHHGVPFGDRLYTGWWDLGMVILDISDPTDPTMVSRLDLHSADGPSHNTHSAHPLPGRDALVTTDESIVGNYCNIHEGGKEFHARIVDISDEKNPRVISRFPFPEDDYCHCARGGRLGPHNIHEMRPGSFQDDSLVFMTWFNGGLRVYDVSDLENPSEVARFVPAAPEGRSSSQVNDVYVDGDGLVYATERYGGGLYILELDL